MIIQDSPLVGLFYRQIGICVSAVSRESKKNRELSLAIMIDQADAHMSARSLCAEIIVLFPFSDRKNQVKRT